MVAVMDGSCRDGLVHEQHDAHHQHPAREHQQDRGVERDAQQQEGRRQVAEQDERAGEELRRPHQPGRREHVHACGADAVDEHQRVPQRGQRPGHVRTGQRRAGELGEEGDRPDRGGAGEEQADEDHARGQVQPVRDLRPRAGTADLQQGPRGDHVPQAGDPGERNDVQPEEGQRVDSAAAVEGGVRGVGVPQLRDPVDQHETRYEQGREHDPGPARHSRGAVRGGMVHR